MNDRRNKKNSPRPKPEFEQKLVDLARVTRVTKGGKRLNFRALIVIGDKKGRVGYGLDKGKDVTIAISKAVEHAKKNMITVKTVDGTISHEIRHKFSSARIMLKPAPLGTGVKAGGAVRTVLDMAGIENAVGKIMGSNNKINNVKCTYEALAKLKAPRIQEKKKKEDKQQIKNDGEIKPEVKK